MILRYGPLLVDRSRFLCMNNGHIIPLANMELAILELLMKFNGQVVSREVIAQNIWAEKHLTNYRVIDTHISNIRKALSNNKDEFIIGIRRLGYKFNVVPPQRVKLFTEASPEKLNNSLTMR